jgi:homoserine kinase type II
MAVYTEVDDAELIDFISTYDIGALLSCKGIAEGVENSNFYLQTRTGNFILTLYEKRVCEADLPFFLNLMEHLSTRGMNCPQPVKNRDGAALGRLSGRPAAIVTFLEGYSVHHPEPLHCANLGEALAHLHIAGGDFSMRRPNRLSVDDWRALFVPYAERADEVEKDLRELIESELSFLERHWPRDLPDGVIHADLFPDNVFFLGDQISGLIDFYFACTDTLAYDLAICLNAWCFAPDHTYRRDCGIALLTAYQRLRPLSKNETKAFPILARGAAMRFLLTRFIDSINIPPGALVRPKDPAEYLSKLRFHREIAAVDGYGLS